MKRKLWMAVLTVMALFALVIGVAGCNNKSDEPKQLNTPVVHISEDGVASWEADVNASAYIYKIDGGAETPTQETSKQLTDGQSISVKALAKSGSGYTDSEFSTPETYTVNTHAHTYGTPEWDWTGNQTDGYTAATAKFSCGKCDDVQEVPAKISSAISKKATCIEEGKKDFTASVTFKDTNYEDKKTVTLAVDDNAHTYGTPEWEWAGNDTDGYTATATFTCSRDSEHTLVKPATVSSEKKQEGCAENMVYTATVTVNFGEKTYTKDKTVRTGGTAHVYGEWHEAVPATCVKSGMKAYQECTKCHLYFDADDNKIADEDGADLIIAINENAHAELKEVKGQAPTCETPGYEAYWQCDDCNKKYSDSEGEEFIASPKEIKALGHDYKLNDGEPKKLPTNDAEGEAVVTCSHENCDGDKTKTIKLPALIGGGYTITGEDATCTQGGEKHYSITIDKIDIEFTITTEALGHDAGKWEFDKDGHYWQCTRCDGSLEDGGLVYKEHTAWAGEWTPDDNNTTHSNTTACTEHTDKQYTVSEKHDYTEKTGHCDVCNAEHVHGDALEIVDDGEDGHILSCDVCGYIDEEAHDFKDGAETCKVCGAENPDIREFTATYVATEVAKQRNYADKAAIPDPETVTVKRITITIDKASAQTDPAYYSPSVRLYGGSTITFAAPSGYIIAAITFSFQSGGGSNALTASVGSIINDNTQWTGYSQSVIITISGATGHRRVQTIEIKYERLCEHPQPLEKVDRVAPKCEEVGYEAYWKCTVCDRMFDSETGENLIPQPKEIQATGHEFGNWQKTEDGSQHIGTCIHDDCSETKTEDHSWGDGNICTKCKTVNEKTPEKKVEETIDELRKMIEARGKILNEELTLPAIYPDVELHITSDNNAIKQSEDGKKLIITRGDEDIINIQLTVWGSCGDYNNQSDPAYIGDITVQKAPYVPDEKTITLTVGDFSGFNNSSYAVGTATVSSVKFTGYFMQSSDTFQARQNSDATKNSYLYNTTAIPGSILSVVITYTKTFESAKWTCYFGDSSMSTNPATGGKTQGGNTETSLTINAPEDSSFTYFRLYRAGSNACNMSKFEIKYDAKGGAGGGTTTPEPHECHNKCTEAGCGLCTDNACQDPACLPKCPGHSSTENPGGGAWKLVTDANNLKDGAKILFALTANSTFYVNGDISGTSFALITGATTNTADNTLNISNAADAHPLTLGKVTNGWTLATDANSFVYITQTGKNNKLGTTSTASSATWTISISSDVASVALYGQSDYNRLRWYSAGFTNCRASTGGAVDPAIYMWVE